MAIITPVIILFVVGLECELVVAVYRWDQCVVMNAVASEHIFFCLTQC